MHLFTYGTLMFPEVWRIVVGKDFETLPAQLPGHEIFRVAGALYPGIVKVSSQPPAVSHQLMDSPSGSRPSTLDPRLTNVPGLLYLDLDPESLARLDAFESDFYTRQSVTVLTTDGRERTADAYIVPTDRRDFLTTEVWTKEDFLARGLLREFVARYSGFNRLAEG